MWIQAEKNMDTHVKNNETHAVGVNSTSTTGAKHVINVGKDQAVLTMDKDGNALLEANTSIKLKVKNNFILITPDAIEIQVVDGDLKAQATETASFKGVDLTVLGEGTHTEVKASDNVDINGTNTTNIKGGVVNINS